MINFSVSMCVYGKDNPEWFRTAVDSILHQTIAPNEVVLVVDGPVPKKLNDVITRYETNSIFNVIRFDQNQGHGKARNASLNACTNELVAIMDADDISAPDRFEKQLDLFRKNIPLDVVGGQISEFIESPLNVVGKRIVPTEDSEIKKYLKQRCPMNLVTVMFKRLSIEKAGGFIDWYCEEDYYLWIRMYLSNMVFANINEVLVNVRVGKDMYARRGGIKYFKSELRLQYFMINNKVINFKTFIGNTCKRLIVQVLTPNRIRGWFFKRFARN